MDNDQEAQAVAAIFAAVGKSEVAVLAEFDLEREARALSQAASLCGGEWVSVHRTWLAEGEPFAVVIPPVFATPGPQLLEQLRGAAVRVPEVMGAEGLVAETALVMTRAGGESMHRLLSGAVGEAEQLHAAAALLGVAVPFIGWLLLCKSSSHLAHVDPHAGNFRWDAGTRELWVLDWGSHVTLEGHRRRALCLLVVLLAAGSEDEAVADAARAFGLSGSNDGQLAVLMRGIFNVSPRVAAQDALNAAAMDQVLDEVDEDVVPVVRCLATLGGMLKEAQRRVRDVAHQHVPLSLASLWCTLAQLGLHD